MKRSESLSGIAKALSQFQAEVKNPSNNATNPQYRSKYATLDNVINTVKPILAKHGLSYIQSPSTLEDGLHIGITTLLMHESGEWIESEPLILPAFKLGRDSVKIYDAQAAGIAVSYGRRYSLSAILGISSSDDDDANGIVHETNSKPEPQQRQPQSQGQNQTYSNNNNTNTASEKQQKLVNSLISQVAKKKEIDKEVAIETLKARVGQFDSVETMTSKLASAAIKYLTDSLG